jgi:hypothetical protein
VTFAEDGCRVRKGSIPQVLAVRNTVIHLLATTKGSAIQQPSAGSMHT